jgi:ribosomal protein S18 acetylase RimI-like enzyme
VLLLAYALNQLKHRGLRAASLDVDGENVTGALRLYRGVGMNEQPSFTIWKALVRKGV